LFSDNTMNDKLFAARPKNRNFFFHALACI